MYWALECTVGGLSEEGDHDPNFWHTLCSGQQLQKEQPTILLLLSLMEMLSCPEFIREHSAEFQGKHFKETNALGHCAETMLSITLYDFTSCIYHDFPTSLHCLSP